MLLFIVLCKLRHNYARRTFVVRTLNIASD